MNIGIDFDGVLIDSERLFKYYADYYSFFELGGRERKRDDVVKQQFCFDWSEEEMKNFFNKYVPLATMNAPFLLGTKEILTKLKKDGHKLFLVTSRYNSCHYKEIEQAKQRIEELGIAFDQFYAGPENKYEVCKRLGVDIMIDDNPDIIKQFTGKDIFAFFFQNTVQHSFRAKNVFTANSWVDVYRKIKFLKEKRTS